MIDSLYHYKAIVKRVVDGDTVDLDVSLGFDIWIKDERIRLSDINAPEVRGGEKEQGLASKAFLQSLLPVDSEVILETNQDKQGKFGRYLGTIWCKPKNLWISANATMVHEGYAEFKRY